ncbi:MAG TPA: ABC transporter ATP-binding protein [Methanospirillum sp.]|uniref:ABC transporter ATP-binding protein n=1 Tax=Methanospirillum sp. TaxID=45200 RepID=UPI002CDFBDF6|nr:ABC transporter ATP-binding protein [Methanospirillum sp.]HWQ63033.1 ABC transporter ATP-binding protein [Methanospirillum sp.]
MTLLDVQGLNVRFPTGDGEVHASRDVSFSLDTGEVLGLVGETGSGKSVIGQAVIKILPSNAEVTGEITFDGKNLNSLSDKAMHHLRGRSISLVPQNPSGSLDPVTRNGEQISEVVGDHCKNRNEIVTRVHALLSSVGLVPAARIAEEFPHQLSGGMRQRLTTSIAVSEKPRLIIADEPTKGLDFRARAMTATVLSDVQKQNECSLLLITHDLDLAEMLCARIAVIYAGEIVEIAPVSRIFSSPRHPYTRALIQAIPKNGLIPIAGQSPSLLDLPAGCSFADRCEYCSDVCRMKHPDLLNESIIGGVRCHHPFSN